MTTLIVSTHFDDAVFSCWTLLESEGDVEVATVFTAGPAPGCVTPWDADSGVDSATRMVQRAEENRRALALAGRKPVDLGLLEKQYGGGTVPKPAIEPHLWRAEVVYVPAAVAIKPSQVNAEHRTVRDVCLSVRPDARLYVDQPYCHFRAAIGLPGELAASSAGELRRVDVDLSPEQRDRKASAIRCYAGELAKLENIFGPCTRPERLRHEGFWERA